MRFNINTDKPRTLITIIIDIGLFFCDIYHIKTTQDRRHLENGTSVLLNSWSLRNQKEKVEKLFPIPEPAF
jgi:hypothetical protein